MSVANIGMLQEPFRKRKSRRHSRGLRNNFATPSYLHRAAKMASTLRFPASFSRHKSGIVRRRNITLFKKAAKSLRNKRVISQHFGKCFLQLGVIGLQWLQLLRFNSELCIVWSIGFLTSWALKWYIACIIWTSSRICFMADSLYFFSLQSGFTLGKWLLSFTQDSSKLNVAKLFISSISSYHTKEVPTHLKDSQTYNLSFSKDTWLLLKKCYLIAYN